MECVRCGGPRLRVVGGGRHAAAVARPVGVDELSWLGQEFVGVSPEVIPLSLRDSK